jgi:DNA-binding NarL/FixJ family response regulator
MPPECWSRSRITGTWNEGRAGGIARDIDLALTVRLVAPPATPDVASASAAPPPSGVAELGLSPREQEVLPLLAWGQTNQQIGQAIGISRRAATVHIASILDKLGVASRAVAVARVHRDRLV